MQFEIGKIYFNRIILIQSIPQDERQTGTEIHNDYLVRHSWIDANLEVELVQIETREEFINILERIVGDTFARRYLPYIHFEFHGAEESIVLSTGNKVKYSEFISLIRQININTKNNLFISISACWGGRIQFETDISEPCPFRGFIGPMDQIYPEDLIVSFSSYFDELLRTNDFDAAIKRLNLYNQSGVQFNHYNAETFFDDLLEHQKEKSIRNPDEKEKYVLSEARKRWKEDPRLRTKFRTRSNLREMIRKIADKVIPKSYDQLRENFLHIRIRKRS